jgi:hypothetical protein
MTGRCEWGRDCCGGDPAGCIPPAAGLRAPAKAQSDVVALPTLRIADMYPFVRVVGWNRATGKWRICVKAWTRRA